MNITKKEILYLLVFTLAFTTGNDLPVGEDDYNSHSASAGYYKVRLGSNAMTSSSAKLEALQRKFIPEGCYGQKQLLDILRSGQSKISFIPKTPAWCLKSDMYVPEEYFKMSTQQQTPPPYQIDVYPFQNSDVFRVVVNSMESQQTFTDAILVAKGIDEDEQMTASTTGRFAPSEGVRLICCSKVDKDIAWYKSAETGTTQAVFYWRPETNKATDISEAIIFQATIAKNSKVYWVNVTSDMYNVREGS